MTYFQNINTLEQAKIRYRILEKQLHPDKGGYITLFQQMQQEYKAILQKLNREQRPEFNQTISINSDVIDEIGKLAKVLVKKQVPQTYLKKKMQNSKSKLEKDLYSEIIGVLDRV